MKKILGLLLALIMVFTMIPTAALAEDPPPEPTPTETPAPMETPAPTETPEPTPTGTPEPDYDETRNILGHDVHVDFYLTSSEHTAKVYIDGNYSEVQSSSTPPDIRKGEHPEGWGDEANDPTCGGSMEAGFFDPERTNQGLGPCVTVPGLVGDYRYLGSQSRYGYTADIYRKDKIVCFYGGEANYLEWDERDSLGVMLCAISWFLPAAAGFEMIALALNAANAVFTGSQIMATSQTSLFLELIYFYYDYAIVLPDGTTIKELQRRYGYFYVNKGYAPDYYDLREREFYIMLDDGTYWYNNIGFISNYIDAVLSYFDRYGEHAETYTDDSDCYCNYCNTPRHKYDSCTDIDCNRCGETRTPGSCQLEWRETPLFDEHGFQLLDENGLPLKGHVQGCKNCLYIVPGSIGSHSYGEWRVELIHDPDEYNICSVCELSQTLKNRDHDLVPERYYIYSGVWSWVSPADICNLDPEDGLGYVQYKCQNNCGYIENEYSLFTPTPAGHIDYDSNGVCDRCEQQVGHPMTQAAWVSVGEYDKCKVFASHCTITGCDYHTFDDVIIAHTYTDCSDDRCNVCYYYRGALSSGTLASDGHVYDDSSDLVCNRCLHQHNMISRTVNAGEYDKCQEYQNYCTTCGYFTAVSYNTGHTYTNCADNTCDVCSYYRGLPGYIETDGHVYDDCFDLDCNRCPHERTEPHHLMTEPAWVSVGEYNKCQVKISHCTRSWCNYYPIEEVDDTHTYSDCSGVCSVCSYNRGTPSHLMTEHRWVNVGEYNRCQEKQNYCARPGCDFYTVVEVENAHTYSDCSGVCSVCSYNRGTPNHLMTGYRWVGVGEYDKCQEYQNYCTACGYFTAVSYNTSHTYTNCADNTCDVCSYFRDLPCYIETDGHVYDDCFDLDCNRCPHERTEPHHLMTEPVWVAVGEYNKCRVKTSHCTRSWCSYYPIEEVDNTHTYSDCAAAVCTVCSYNRGQAPNGYLESDGHIYDNCDDLVCNRCLHERTTPGHIMAGHRWVNVGEYNKCREYQNYCTRPGCSHYTVENVENAHTYSDCSGVCSVCSYNRGTPSHLMTGYRWVDVGAYNKCREYQNYCTRSGCSYYAVEDVDSSHSYSNCQDSDCNGCSYNRGSSSGFLETDGHMYNSCTDLECNRCLQDRTSAHHLLSGYRWVDVGEYNKCREYQNYCTRSGCSYYTVDDVDGSHSYSNCQDSVCNECSYNRGSVSGILYSDGHIYTDCADTACNRCSHTRAALSHTYPSWTNYSSTQHRRACNVCDHYVYANHIFSSWVKYSTTQHKRTCSSCGRTEYQSHTWTYIPGSGSVYKCNVCGAYK